MGNRQRDQTALAGLRQGGWRVMVIWECALKGPRKLPVDEVIALCDAWLRNPEALIAETRGLEKAR